MSLSVDIAAGIMKRIIFAVRCNVQIDQNSQAAWEALVYLILRPHIERTFQWVLQRFSE